MMQESSNVPNSTSNNTPDRKFVFKTLDIYQKINDEYKVQTSSGAAFSIFGWLIIFVLVLAEFRNYAVPVYQEHMRVDSSLSEQLLVNINITFHALTCNEAHLDVMDIAGYNQLNVEHDMVKQRLSSIGVPIGKAGVEIIGEGPIVAEDLPKDYCGSCYGAETEAHRCCNTCDELVRAYQEKDWNVAAIIRNSTQCIHDRAKHFAEVNRGEGCTLSGVMKVNKVAGNFHIAHGESIVRDGRHIHHFNPALAPQFNVSHTINSLTFGILYPNMPLNPLDKVQRIIGKENSTGLFQYFIRVIPTVYTDDFGRKTVTNQYTVTDRFRPFIMPKFDGTDKPADAVMPGIFFVYEISPFMIEATGQSIPFTHFLTKVCAIIGGVLTIMGVLDGLVYKIQKLLIK